MKAGFLPEGYSLRKVTEVDLLIADYIVNSSDEEIIETDTVWLHEGIRECWDAPQRDEGAECYFIIDPKGNVVGYAELYNNFKEDAVMAL